MRFLAAYLCLLCGIAPSCLAEAPKACSPHDLHTLASGSLRATDWRSLHGSYVKFRQCDSGGDVSEGFSDAVVHLLAANWRDLPALRKLLDADRPFDEFVMRHIDATTSDRELAQIELLAESSCPSGLSDLCARIKIRARSALEESKAFQDAAAKR